MDPQPRKGELELMGQERKRRKLAKKAAALFLAALTFMSTIAGIPGGARADEADFTVERLEERHMLADVDFPFFHSRMASGIYYWMKSDGTPVFCVQKTAVMTDGFEGKEEPEPIGECGYFTTEQYEMASIVLQCCGLKKGDGTILEPGAYLAGQAAIWGIQSEYWTGTEKLKEEMEVLYQHVKPQWHGLTREEIVVQARAMMEPICQALDDYYGDDSPYIPAFASKYPEKAPIHQAQWQEDGSCGITFSLGDKAEAVKDFTYQLPEGWSFSWEGDQVTFRCQEPVPGLASFIGTAPGDSRLDGAMPIGLIYIVSIPKAAFLQHLASYVEMTAPWICYFRLSVPEKPEEGSWYLPKVQLYRHQETFKAQYRIELEKRDGDTGAVLPGVEFKILEYFDESQLEGTMLEKGQFSRWEGWKKRCPEEITDSSGRITHQDQKEYQFEKTYCGGHPEPEIFYEGSSEEFLSQLEAEAWQAWEESVEACSQLCDFHGADGSGREMAREERDLAYNQFIHLVYGYTLKETKPLEGYYPLGEDPKGKPIGKVFCQSLQAGGQFKENLNQTGEGQEWDELRLGLSLSGQLGQSSRLSQSSQLGQSSRLSQSSLPSLPILPGRSEKPVCQVMAASRGNAEREDGKEESEEKDGESKGGEESEDGEKLKDGENLKGGEKSQDREVWKEIKTGGLRKAQRKNWISLENIGNFELASSSEAGKKKRGLGDSRNLVWLTSEIDALKQDGGESLENAQVYQFQIENHKPETPEETTPEETPPEETTPEETPPEETTPEETLPEETTPEETPPEETTPEETTPEETLPEETVPKETMPKETPPEEPSPEEPLPPETPPQEPPSPPRTGSQGGGGSGRPQGPERMPKIQPEETQPPISLPSGEASAEEILKVGWVSANYVPSVYLDENGVPLSAREGKRLRLPKTGDPGEGNGVWFGLTVVSGLLALCWLGKGRKRKKEKKSIGAHICPVFLPWLLPALLAAIIPLTVQAKEIDPRTIVPKEASEEQDLVFCIPAGEGEEFTPDQSYIDEAGQEYELVSCQLTVQEKPEREEAARKVYSFEGLEGESQVPRQIAFPLRGGERESEGEAGGAGQLELAQILEVHQHWEDGFAVPVIFYDYGADYYDFQGVRIPKGLELAYLQRQPQLLLEEIGCSSEQYRIEGIAWDGESYVEQGISCRKALAFGKKLLSDYVAAYEGELRYPKIQETVWELLYRPAAPVIAPLPSEPGEEAVLVIENTMPGKEQEKAEPKSMENVWELFRTLAIYSVSLAVFIPLLVYLILLLRKRKNQGKREKMPRRECVDKGNEW